MSEELKPCPFCGATPHRGLGKVQHCQLHGEPFQRAYVRCPKGHAQVDEVNMEQAIAAWNTRQSAQIETLAVLEQARETLDGMLKAYDGIEVRIGCARDARQALTTLTAKIEEIRNGQG